MSSGEVPEERCGFVLEPGDVDVDGEVDRYEAESAERSVFGGAVGCWRPTWDGANDGRYIWHAGTDDKPAGALADARADGPERSDGASLPTVESGDAIDFENRRLWAATFEGTGLREASFAEVDGWFGQFPDADLGGTSFDGARMHLGIVEEDGAEFDGATVFGWSQLELDEEWDRAARGVSLVPARCSASTRCRERSAGTEFEKCTCAARRRSHPTPIQRTKRALARWTTLYGESPHRVVPTSPVVVGGCALLYPRGERRDCVGPDRDNVSIRSGRIGGRPRWCGVGVAAITYPFGAGELVVGLGKSPYFSVITFTTLGHGDVQPLGFGEALATVESFVGALPMALLVHVLGRRATW